LIALFHCRFKVYGLALIVWAKTYY
jgi:hypothetical protein